MAAAFAETDATGPCVFALFTLPVMMFDLSGTSWEAVDLVRCTKHDPGQGSLALVVVFIELTNWFSSGQMAN